MFFMLYFYFFSKLFLSSVGQLGRACSQIDCMHTGSPCFSKRHLFVHDLTTIRDPLLRLQMIDEWRVNNTNQLFCKTAASIAPYFFLDGEPAHVWMTRFGRACPQYCWKAPGQNWRGRVGKERASNQPSCQQIAPTPFLLFTHIEYFLDRPNHFLAKLHFYHIYSRLVYWTVFWRPTEAGSLRSIEFSQKSLSFFLVNPSVFLENLWVH